MRVLTDIQKEMYDELKFLVDNWHNREHHEDQTLITEFIKSKFREAGAIVSEQGFNTRGFEHRTVPEFYNIIGSYGPQDAPRIIVGAHYDVCGNPGADDNGSGIAGLLALARQLQGMKLKKRIDLVAYANEEPPFFGGDDMGSAHHSRMLKNQNVDVELMICFEMIGVFYHEKGSQTIPEGMELFAPLINKGDFIAVCGRLRDRDYVNAVNSHMGKGFGFPVAVPEFIGYWLRMSDHMNYWDAEYPAIMLTDTAMYRHRPGEDTHYHGQNDTLENIDFEGLERVVRGTASYIEEVAGEV